jgi:hypothetical protein
MPAQGISKIYLSISRGFHFNPQDKDLQSKYDFFADNRSYFDKVVKDVQYIGRRDLTIEKLGKMRSILDLSSNGCGADNFFQFFQDYYCNLATKGLYLIPHYPCVVDILPTADTQYGIDLSTFPESFRNATVAKISVSIRLYPIGLGSLKLGLYLQTKESFNIQDITELLRQKER